MGVRRSGGGIKVLRASLGEIDKLDVKVGFFETARYPDGTPVAYVASIQEFGAPSKNIPPRSFMRRSIIENSKAWNEEFAGLATAILTKGVSPRDGLDMMGMRIAGDVAKTIKAVDSPPLAPATIRAKNGVEKPLVDTGQMIQSVTHEVVEK